MNKHVRNKVEFQVIQVDGSEMNRWLSERHYLHRPIIRSKLLAYSVDVDGDRVGGILWATPHFTKKKGLFGFPGLPDKWEVLMLARFYLKPDSGIVASSALSKSIGKKGNTIQTDWVRTHPPVYPDEPFVPRLLISWSDAALKPVECSICHETHNGAHQGIIYKASNWKLFDVTNSSGTRTGEQSKKGEKKLWIYRLPRNTGAEKLGQLSDVTQTQMSLL